MTVDPIAAEAKAVEQGAHAFLKADGSYVVRSASRPTMRHRVTCDPVSQQGRWVVRLRCTCESGSARPSAAVACWHGALVGRRLEREGWARWDAGAWVLTAPGLDRVRGGPVTPDPEPEPPHVQKMSGRCPVCSAFMTVEVAPDQDPKVVAASHEPSCAEKYADERALLAQMPNIDLWKR